MCIRDRCVAGMMTGSDLKKVYTTFNEAFIKDPSSFSNPKHLYNYFKTFYDRYKQNDPEVTTELLFNKYEEISEKFEVEEFL